jgi:hypothetical protein
MEDYLYQKELFLPLGGIEKNPTTMKDEEWEVIDRKALGRICLSLAVSVAFNILKEKIAKELMDALAKPYEKPLASNNVFIMKRLFNMNMLEGRYVADYLNEFNMVTNQLGSIKVDFDYDVRALIILCSLQESWNDLVMAVSNSVSSSNTLKFDDVVGVILTRKCNEKS